MTLVPKSCVVGEEIVVRLPEIEVFVKALILALQQHLEGF